MRYTPLAIRNDTEDRLSDPLPSDMPTLRPESRPPEEEPTLLLANRAPGPASPQPLPSGGRPFGRYLLLEELGHGGMGVVWKAHDTQLRRTVALKTILSSGAHDAVQVERFIREARAAARLSHPNIVPVYDVGEFEGQHYYTTECLDARPLDAVMKDPVPRRQALLWVRSIADALASAHAQGIVHRDVKPGNILIDRDAKPHVMDFGLAKQVDAAGSRTAPTLTVEGDLLGTPRYMSPEQTRGSQDVGPASDQFSLGVLLYELITGHPAFQGQALQDLLNAITDLDPVPPRRWDPKIHPDLEAITMKALEKDPARRYASLGDLARDLQRFLDDEPTQARPVSPLVRLLRRVLRRKEVVLPFAALVLLAVSVGVWAIATNRHSREDVSRADQERRQSDEAARKAEEARKKTLAVLEKTRAVTRVLSRWNGLSSAIAELERSSSDTGTSAEEKRRAAEGPWKQLEQFMRDTPRDAASQATMLALAGWARCLAGREEEGIGWMRKAEASDSEVPYGCLMQGLVWLVRYAQSGPAGRVFFDSAMPVANPAGAETPGMIEARQQLAEVLRHAQASPIWGEAQSQEFASVLDAVRAMERADPADAEKAFAIAIGSPELRPFEPDLRLMRSKERFLAGRFDDGLQDIDAVLQVRPGDGTVYDLRAAEEISRAMTRDAAPADSASLLRRALEDMDAAERRGWRPWGLLSNRGSVLFAMAIQMSEMAQERMETLDRSLKAMDEAAGLAPGEIEVRVRHGQIAFALGQSEAMHGARPVARYEQAIQDYDAGIARNPDDPGLRNLRGIACSALAAEHLAAGLDVRKELRGAVADFGAMVARWPDYTPARLGRGHAGCLLGVAEADQGEDGAMDLGLAIGDLDAVIAKEPMDARPYMDRALAAQTLARGETARGQDASERLRRAIADYGAALERGPANVGVYPSRAGAWLDLARAETSHGADPMASYRHVLADCDSSVEKGFTVWQAFWLKGSALYELCEFDGAVEALQQAITNKRAAEPNSEGLLRRARALAAAGKAAPWARTAFQARLALLRHDLARARALNEEAIGAAEGATAKGAAEQDPVQRSILAETHRALAGILALDADAKERDAAFDHIERAMELGADKAELENDPDLAPLRDDPRWRNLGGRK